MDAMKLHEAGPLMKQFSDIFGCTVYHPGGVKDYSEVLDWVNAYCNGPWPDSLIPHLEPTYKERLESIKAYIKWRVDESMTERVKKCVN
jgi:hypothetical protein